MTDALDPDGAIGAVGGDVSPHAKLTTATTTDKYPRSLRLAAQGPADASELASTVANKMVEKHHPYLDEELLSLDYASAYLDTDGAWTAVVRLVAEGETSH